MSGSETAVPAGAMEWVYSKDAANGTVLALKADELGSRVFNITMGKLVRPQELADALQTVVPGAKVRIETPAGTAVSLPDMIASSDLSRAQSVLGYKPQFDLVDALRDMAAWMRDRR